MTVKVFVATHGPLAESLLSSMEMIIGPQNDIEAMGLMPGIDPVAYQEKLSERIEQYQGDCLILFDLLGGSPFNSMISKLYNQQIYFVSGVNLGMLLEVMLNRENMDVEELAHHAKRMGIEGIIEKSDLFSEGSEKE